MNTTPPAQPPEVIREWDRRAIEEFGVPGVVLMENAGRGAAEILRQLARDRPERFGPPWIILCGAGNNGGDGFVVARHLHNAGHEAELWLSFDPARLEPGRDNTVMFEIVRSMGLSLRGGRIPFGVPESLLGRPRGTIVDALLGTGIARPLREPLASWVRAVNESPLPAVALDLPTGLDANSGRILADAIRAEHTVTFAAPKIGFGRESGPDVTGQVHIVDIGMPREVWQGP